MTFTLKSRCHGAKIADLPTVPPCNYNSSVTVVDATETGEQWLSWLSWHEGRQAGPVVLFRPDKYRHAVRRVEGGTRYVLSLGWIC